LHHKCHNKLMTNDVENKEDTETNHSGKVLKDDLISKSQRKRDANAAQDLGKNILALSQDAQNSIDLPENLVNALNDARRIKKNSALKRQLQYIGKLMRHIDLEPIQAQYLKLTNHYDQDIKALHNLEKWRDRLLAEGDKALEELLNEAPTADRQHLRQLIRQSAKETKLKKPPKSAREIFKYLKTLFE